MADKFRRTGRLRGTIDAVLLCAALVLLAAGGALGAPASNQLLAVKMETGAASPTVLIQTAEAVGYRYTVYDSFDPIRVVVDFPGMTAGAIPAMIEAGPAPLKELRVAKFDLSSGSLTRIEIVLAANADYQVVMDGNDFRVVFPGVATAQAAPRQEPAKPQAAAGAVTAPAPAPAVAPAPPETAATGPEATIIKEVTIAPGRILFATNGAVGRYEYFTLATPPRLVVDLYGLRPGFKPRAFDVTGGMKQVRVGAYGDKIRFVFDAEGKSLPEHTVEKQVDGLAVSWGRGIQGASAPVAAAVPVDAAVAPVETVAVPAKKAVPTGRQVSVEGLDFVNRDGRSYVVVALSAPANLSQPVQDGNLVRFEIKNAVISRSLRRSIDASAFPSAVNTVTPYLVTDDGKPAVRIAVELKGSAPFTLADEGEVVKLVVDDGAYAEAVPPAVTTKEVVADMAATDAAAASDGSDAAEQIPELDGPKYTGQKISLVFDNADIRSILQLIGDVSGLNILASSDVGGTITLRLIDVPWDQALELVLDTANLGKLQEGNVVRIMPVGKIRERELASFKVKKDEVDEGVLESRAFSVSYSKVDDIRKFLTDLSSKRGSIIADPRNKQLIVKDVASVLDQMAEMVKRIDKPERQVMIEARIVEANTNFARQLGVKWNFDYEDSSDPNNQNGDITNATLGLGGSFLVANPAALAGLGSSISFGALDGNLNIDLRLRALEASGEGKIVSTPRVTTLNGQKALISQGTKIPYSTTSDTGTNVSFENAELKLDVTPEINPDGSVILDIKASNSAVGQIYQTSNGETPAIDEKKAETKVLVRDGQTTVIGGIFVETENNSNDGVPYLKDIPYLGHLFKSSSTNKSRRELLIFITPRILES